MKITLIFIAIIYFVYNCVLAFNYYKDTGDKEYIYEHGYTTKIGRICNVIGLLFFGLLVELYYEIKYSW